VRFGEIEEDNWTWNWVVLLIYCCHFVEGLQDFFTLSHGFLNPSPFFLFVNCIRDFATTRSSRLDSFRSTPSMRTVHEAELEHVPHLLKFYHEELKSRSSN
jgi:hypothetical protein